MIVLQRLIAVVSCSTALLLSSGLVTQPKSQPESQSRSQQESQRTSLSLSEIPNGEHYYVGHPSSELSDEPRVLLSKWGRVVVGISTRLHLGRLPLGAVCFKGFVEGDKIMNATRVLPPYAPDSQWDYLPGEMLDLSQYEKVASSPAAEDTAALGICLEVFSR